MMKLFVLCASIVLVSVAADILSGKVSNPKNKMTKKSECPLLPLLGKKADTCNKKMGTNLRLGDAVAKLLSTPMEGSGEDDKESDEIMFLLCVLLESGSISIGKDGKFDFNLKAMEDMLKSSGNVNIVELHNVVDVLSKDLPVCFEEQGEMDISEGETEESEMDPEQMGKLCDLLRCVFKTIDKACGTCALSQESENCQSRKE